MYGLKLVPFGLKLATFKLTDRLRIALLDPSRRGSVFFESFRAVVGFAAQPAQGEPA
jgi:hypothetical protein